MHVELLDPEAELLAMLLVKELEETRVEIHHAKNLDFKEGLEQRAATLRMLIGKFAHAPV